MNMLRTRACRGVVTLQHTGPWRISSRYFATNAVSSSGATVEELNAARQWLANFDPDTIPKTICDLSFSRSSGPGGQNVNKVNSKATLRVPVRALLRLVPNILHEPIKNSRYYAVKSEDIIIQADDSRKQSDNVQTCFQRLHSVITEAGSSTIPGETSQAQQQRVKGLQKAENESRLRMKKTHSLKKSARRGGGRSSDY